MGGPRRSCQRAASAPILPPRSRRAGSGGWRGTPSAALPAPKAGRPASRAPGRPAAQVCSRSGSDFFDPRQLRGQPASLFVKSLGLLVVSRSFHRLCAAAVEEGRQPYRAAAFLWLIWFRWMLCSAAILASVLSSRSTYWTICALNAAIQYFRVVTAWASCNTPYFRPFCCLNSPERY